MIVLLDNYDSFTYNLVQYLGELGADVSVFRNDEVSVEKIESMTPSHIVISPGPCTPNEAGITLELIGRLAGKVPLLGVCLGHQAIGQAFGGKVVRARKVMHGKTSRIGHDGKGIFEKIPDRFVATRYHSLVVERASLPACLDVTADAEDGEIMGLRHRSLPVEGVQFHPEALLTEHGHKMLQNFIQETGREQT
jgi:anthranilate synthase/aminodeoxychorismate synthase-like glutamine amidotransferase